MRVRQRHLPTSPGNGVPASRAHARSRCRGRSGSRPHGRRVLLTPPDARRCRWPRAAGGIAEAGEQDPHRGLQRQRRLSRAPARRATRPTAAPEPGQGELVHARAGALGGGRGRQLVSRQRRDVRRGAAAGHESGTTRGRQRSPITAGDPALGGPGSGRARAVNTSTGSLLSFPQQRSCLKHRPAQRDPLHSREPSSSRGAAAWSPAAAERRRTPPRTGPRLPGRGGSHHSGPAGGALPSCTPGCGTRPGRGPRRPQIAGEQHALTVPLPGTPGRIQPGPQPLQPPVLTEPFPAGVNGRSHLQRSAAHRYRLAAATASTARRLSS